MSPPRSRRALLASIGLAGLTGLAGCSDGPRSSRGATDVIIHNEASVSRTVAVTVTEEGGESPNIDSSLGMKPHSTHTINNEVIMNNDYDVDVSYTDDRRESRYEETQEWTDAGPPLHIILDDQIVFAVQIG